MDSASGDGKTVYDSAQKVYWLADANLAGNAAVRAQMGVTGINANGTMDYPTAQRWVQALNGYDKGAGYLGHNDWQLPVTPPTDTTCAVLTGGSGNSFGPSCTGSALGKLYGNLLGLTYPSSVVPRFTDTVGPFQDLQPSLYWSSDKNASGEGTFSFATNASFSNTTKYNYLHVLPKSPGAIGNAAPTGTGVLPYLSGPAAGKAVYDSKTQLSWSLDANLAASAAFDVAGMTTVPGSGTTVLTVPFIDASGTMLLATTTTWLAALNQALYAGAGTWTLPAAMDLETLFTDLKLQPGDNRLVARGSVGPFQNLQPGFYWACQRDQTGDSRSPCNGGNPGTSPNGTTPMEWSFDFDLGFQGTDESTKAFYVMVYRPASG